MDRSRSSEWKGCGLRSFGIVAAVMACFLAIVTTAQAAIEIKTFTVIDHPDGAALPPPYGLRLDNLFDVTPESGSVTPGPGTSGVTTFSFVNVQATVTTNTTTGDISVNIAGDVHGGRDTGGGYGFGEGDYAIDFTYSANVSPDGNGWKVSPMSSSNQGTIEFLSGSSAIAAGTTWRLYEQENNAGNTFVFKDDYHRLSGTGLPLDTFVGRGWLDYTIGGTSVTQDWLFIAPDQPSLIIVPVPAAAPMGLAGLVMMGMCVIKRYRRRIA